MTFRQELQAREVIDGAPGGVLAFNGAAAVGFGYIAVRQLLANRS